MLGRTLRRPGSECDVPGAIEGYGLDLATLAEQGLQLLVVEEAVGRQVPHLRADVSGLTRNTTTHRRLS